MSSDIMVEFCSGLVGKVKGNLENPVIKKW